MLNPCLWFNLVSLGEIAPVATQVMSVANEAGEITQTAAVWMLSIHPVPCRSPLVIISLMQSRS